jgi:hypothetical protein
VRYKALRGLGRLVADHPEITVERKRIETLAYRNVVEHLRLLSHRAHIEEDDEPTARLLVGLLDDKLSQSLERVFRLLKIAFRDEDLHRVHEAALGHDKRNRANAAEFLDTLLGRPDQLALRTALRIVIDDLPAEERVARAEWVLTKRPPQNALEAIASLLDDADVVLATIAAEYAARHHDAALVAAARNAKSARPALAESGRRFFAVPEVRHV